MSVLKFREEKKEACVIFYLEGILNTESLTEIQVLLERVSKEAEPEFILLELSDLQVFAKNCISSLCTLAEAFSQKGRELAVCACPAFLEMVALFTPPLTYYPTLQQAIEEFRQSFPAGQQKSAVELLLTQIPILYLKVVGGPCKGDAILKEKRELVIGRHSKSDLSLSQDMQASRFHCRCYTQDGKFFVEDLKSCNGTLLNNTSLQTPGELKDGDQFQVGDSIIQVKIAYEEKIDTQVGALPIPNLEIPQEEAIGEQSSERESVMARVFMDTQNEGKDTVKLQLNPNDIHSLVKLYDENIVPPSQEQSAAKSALPDNSISSYEGDLQDIALLLTQPRIPTPIMRNYSPIAVKEVIKNQYQVQEVLGESCTAFMLRCIDNQSGNTVFLQYAKEPVRLREIPITHPYLLPATAKYEFLGRPLRLVNPGGNPLGQAALSEFKALQIALMLSDVVSSLHAAGLTGLDISLCHTFYTEKESPQFAIIPTVAYGGTSEEKADFFVLGAFLWECVSASKIPYTFLGGLDEEKMKKCLNNVSSSFYSLVLQILRGELQDLDKIRQQIQRLVNEWLMPQTLANQAMTVQLWQSGTQMSSWVEGMAYGPSCYDESLSQEVSEKIRLADNRDRLVALGQILYHRFFPQGLVAILKEAKLKKLSLALDDKLACIPWELAHDGKAFLLSRFTVAREVWASSARKLNKAPLAFPKMMIVADITPWAQKIKEELMSMMQKEFPKTKLKVFNMTDQFSEIVRQIPMCGICHIIGHSQYDEKYPLSGGWVLPGGQRLLKLRFFDNAPRKPRLLFCQGETRPTNATNRFLGVLWQLGIEHIIGTCWSLQTSAWSVSFYRALFQGSNVENALTGVCKETSDDFRSSLCPVWYGCHGFPIIQKFL
jgi:pSer/pThr/pTyr-binding forkhead associated (FHA) protein/anti-anti-sigma regulatory factor